MKDVLEEIVAWKRIEVEEQKKALPPRQLHAMVEGLLAEGPAPKSMSESLTASPHGIIAEFKRKSPSKGWIHPNVEPEQVVPLYAQSGATALSILTDERYFGGRLEYISRLASPSSPLPPILRKDFIIDEYQLFQARQAGADAVLLIAADLTLPECRTLARTAHELGLEVLLEMHSEAELDYAELDVDMLGINNRNLGTFHTDVANSFRMADRLPADRVRVSESGISQPQTIGLLREAGFRGFLIGETFMREADPGKALKRFIEGLL
ncbi:MAG: indole-3-glycerol phosphate synthase TrpC [Bacteroidaceae bacterium]|nr:indole-3-glycerol phosphate synthase TrpC [Bacteroidaceae bacterium]